MAQQIRLLQEDLDTIRETGKTLIRLTTIVQKIEELTEENHRTIRGSTGDDGLMVRMARLEDMVRQLNAANNVIDALGDAQAVSARDLLELRKEVDTHAIAIGTLTNNVNQLWALQRQSPSLTWLVQNRFKEIALITTLIVGLSVLFVSLLAFPQLNVVWETALQALQRYAGL